MLPSWKNVNGATQLTRLGNPNIGSSTIESIRRLQDVTNSLYDVKRRREENSLKAIEHLDLSKLNMEQRQAEFDKKVEFDQQKSLIDSMKLKETTRHNKEIERLKALGNNTRGTTDSTYNPNGSIVLEEDNVFNTKLPNFSTTTVDVVDKSKIIGSDIDNKKLDKFTNDVTNLTNRFNKLDVQELTEDENKILTKIENLKNSGDNYNEISILKKELENSVNNRLGRDTSLLRGVKSIAKQFINNTPESKSLLDFQTKRPIASYLNALTRDMFTEYIYSDEDAIKYEKLKLKAKKANDDIDKKHTKLDFNTIMSQINTGKDIVKKIENMANNPELYSNVKYGTTKVTKELPIDDQLKALRQYREEYAANGDTSTTSITIDDVYNMVAKIESNNNPNAVNSVTGASGMYQLMPSTLKLASKALGKSEEYLSSPNGQKEAIKWLTGENIKYLNNIGAEVTPANIYKIHQLGANNFKKLANNNLDNNLTVALMQNIPKSYRNKLNLNKYYTSKGKVKSTPKSLKIRQQIANTWNKLYTDKVNKYLPSKTINIIDPDKIKYLDSRIKELSKVLETKNKSTNELATTLSKDKVNMAKDQFKEDMKLYRDKVKELSKSEIKELGITKPTIQAYYEAVKLGNDFPSFGL